MTNVIDTARAVELIERAVTDRGADYVDLRSGDLGAGCKYFVAGRPGCIVGTAYAFAGATADQLDAMDRPRGYGAWTTTVASLIEDEALHRLPVETTEGAAYVFRAAQRVQDEGGSWGAALEAARANAAGQMARVA